MFKEIEAFEFVQGPYSKIGHGTYRLRLKCGHLKVVKASQFRKTQKRAKCQDCIDQQRGRREL